MKTNCVASSELLTAALLVAALLLVAPIDLPAHSVTAAPLDGRGVMVLQLNPRTVGKVTVRNGMGEDNCTTKVTTSRSGTGGVLFSPNVPFSYVNPPDSKGEVQVIPTAAGLVSIRVRWEVTQSSGGGCQQGANGFLRVTVIVRRGISTDAELDNTISLGDPVNLSSGELHDPVVLNPDLFLGGPLPLVFSRYYAAFLGAGGFTGTLGDNWTHNFDVSLAVEGETATVSLFGGKTITFQRDGPGWALSSTERLDHQLLDAEGGGFRFLDLSTTRIYSFDSAGRLTRIEDRNGNALTVTQGTNSPDTVTDGLGRSLAFTYTGGKLTRVEDQTGRGVEFGYTGDDLTSFTGANGATTTYAYTTQGDLSGLMTGPTLPDGSQLTAQTFDGDGRVATQADGEGNVTSFQYGQPPNDEGTVVTDPLGRTSQYVHPGGENLSPATDTAGNSDASTYDQNNRIVSYTNRLGDQAFFAYHQPSGFPAGVTDFSGATWTMEYQQQDQDGFRAYVPARLTFPDGATEQYEYDSRGNLTKFTDRAGEEWTFTYNERGQLLTLTNPLGGTGRYTPNADGSLAEAIDAGGVARNFSYDLLKRMSTIRNGDGSERGLEVDESDNIVWVTDELDRVVQIGYDDNNRIRTMTDPPGNARRFDYDGNSRLASFTDRAGDTRTVQYDPVGNVSEVRNGAGESVRFTYDGRNLLTSITDGLGTSVDYGYDAEQRLTSVTDALGKTGSLVHDAAGRVTGLTAPGGQTINYTYDVVGRMTSTRSATGRSRAFRYDARGNLSQIDVDGITTGYEFNALGELDVLTDPNGNRWLRGYDGGGRQTSLTDPLGRTISYDYDQRGRRHEIQTPLGLTRRTFDAVGQITRNQFFDGTTYDYTHDENNKLLATAGLTLRRDAESRIIDSNGILIEYDSAGRISNITYSPGKEVTYEYDVRGRLTQLSD